jgi:hypothetical protein
MKSCRIFIAMCVLAGGCGSANEISQPNPPPQWYKNTTKQPAPKKTVPVTEPATPGADPQSEAPAKTPTPDSADKNTPPPATNTPKSETDGE